MASRRNKTANQKRFHDRLSVARTALQEAEGVLRTAGREKSLVTVDDLGVRDDLRAAVRLVETALDITLDEEMPKPLLCLREAAQHLGPALQETLTAFEEAIQDRGSALTSDDRQVRSVLGRVLRRVDGAYRAESFNSPRQERERKIDPPPGLKTAEDWQMWRKAVNALRGRRVSDPRAYAVAAFAKMKKKAQEEMELAEFRR